MNDDHQSTLDRIIEAVRRGDVYLTEHSVQQGIEQSILEAEVLEAILAGKVIEDYPSFYIGPACLILGYTAERRSLHVVCSTQNPVAIITAYEPNLDLWEEDLRTRRRRP
ncbi:MAG: DUF4258 domain-containing protein [Chloroflexi bacterium]|nr:DUF4258 domain-containing protein [Chloroflexota bacterium]